MPQRVQEFGQRAAPGEARERLEREVVPLIRAVRERAEVTRRAETERMLARLSHLRPEDRELVEALTRRLLARLLRAPAAQLRAAAGLEGAGDLLEATRSLFGLDDGIAVSRDQRRVRVDAPVGAARVS